MKKDIKNILLLVLFVGILGFAINAFAGPVYTGPTGGEYSCTGVFGAEFLDVLQNHIYAPIKWLTPILLIILTSVDFAKVVFTGKKDDMTKVTNNFLKRAIAALIIFFAPDIVILIVDLVNQHSISSCMNNLR